MSRTLAFPRIDDYLGPAEERFFGAGYRRADHALGPVRRDGGALSGVVAISYPADWSFKTSGDALRPHLSTVDALVLGVQFTEMLLAANSGLSTGQLRGARLRKMVILAGTQPQESLERVPISARTAKSYARDDGSVETTSRIEIGRMRVRLTVDHEVAASGPVGTLPSDPRDDVRSLLEPGHSRFWADGFRTSAQEIGPVIADVDGLEAAAVLSVSPIPESFAGGLGGHPRGVTAVDAFVTTLQLAQVLLYELDGISRSESNTLWMQRATLEEDANRQSETVARVAITESRLLDLADGRWRNVDFTGRVGTFTLRCVFAHRLP